jgi:CHAD domain-containing protein
LTGQVRDTTNYLGRVRDLDILVQETHKYIKEHPDANHESLACLLKMIKKDRRKARKQLAHWLDAKDYGRFVNRAFNVLNAVADHDTVIIAANKPKSTRLDHVLPVLVYDQFETVRAYDELICDASSEMLHNLRLECKRLRYTLEAFGDVFGKEVQSVIDALKTLQEHLGSLNDTQNAIEQLATYEKHLKKSERDAVRLYRDSQKAQAEQLRSTLPEIWSQFNRLEIRQSLAQAIAVL